MSRVRGRNYYGVTITNFAVVSDTDLRVYWVDENRNAHNALMWSSVNTEKVKVGETADVVRNGNGRILALRRPEPEAPAEPVLDAGVGATMVATIAIDLRLPEGIETIGEFLENFRVVGVTVASGGKSVICTGRVVSLVPKEMSGS